MILVDRDIRKMGKDVIVVGFNEENIGAMSYDLTIDYVVGIKNSCYITI